MLYQGGRSAAGITGGRPRVFMLLRYTGWFFGLPSTHNGAWGGGGGGGWDADVPGFLKVLHSPSGASGRLVPEVVQSLSHFRSDTPCP